MEMFKRTILLATIIGLFSSHHHARAATISEVAVVDFMNHERSKHGLPKLKLNTKLNLAAKLKLKDMQDKKYWSHSSPSGTSPFYWIDQVKYNYHYAGENLARGFTNVNDAMKAWMASPSHKKNILNPAYRDTGLTVIAVGIAREKRVAIVSMFGAL